MYEIYKKKQRNELTSCLSNSELKYFGDDLELNKSDLHKTWGTIKKIIGKDANYSIKKIYFQVYGKSTTDGGEIANSFNDFFVIIGFELAKNIVSSTDPMFYVNPVTLVPSPNLAFLCKNLDYKPYSINRCYNSIVIPLVIMAEVRQTILSLKKFQCRVG